MAVLDKYGMYEDLENFYTQIEKGYNIGRDINIIKPVNNVVVAAVGGSAMAGHILKQYLKDINLPITVVEDYHVPVTLDKNTLVFVISYSGNNEETIFMYKDAKNLGCQIISISSGGKLKEVALINKKKHISIPAGLQSRLAYPLMFFPMLRILNDSNLINEQDDKVRKTVNLIKNTRYEELIGNLVDNLKSKTPIIYASTKYEVVAKKWKLNFNENTEIPSFYGIFPGAFYNEIALFAKKSSEQYIILIKSDDEENAYIKSLSEFKKLLRELDIPLTEIHIKGDCYLAKIFFATLISDWLTYSLAIKIGVEPSSRRIIDELKKRMQT